MLKISDTKIYNNNLQIIYSIDDLQIKSTGNINKLNTIEYPDNTINQYHTGCSYFVHNNNSNLVTFVFSAGRHETGYNTYMTIDFSGTTPFNNSKEIIIDKPTNKNNGYSWVSVKSVGDNHYVLFSGDGSHILPNHITPSIMYLFKEDTNGNLIIPTGPIFTQPSSYNGSRYCLLDNLYNSNIDIILLGTFGLEIYSSSSNEYSLKKSINLPTDTTSSAFLGASIYENNSKKYIIIGNRSRWSDVNNNNLNAPNLIYDITDDKIISNFGKSCQTVSIGLINGNSIITGNGGEANIQGSPNIIYKINDTMTVEPNSVDNQLMNNSTTSCEPFKIVSSDYTEILPNINNTKTRQVLPFKIKQSDKYDCILIINSAQPSYIWIPDNIGNYNIVKQLENLNNNNINSYARGGTVYCKSINDNLVNIYIILSIYNDNNIVYKYQYNIN